MTTIAKLTTWQNQFASIPIWPIICLSLLLMLHAVLLPATFQVSRLPESDYQYGSILLAAFSHAPFVTLLVPQLVALIIGRTRLIWSAFDPSGRLKIFSLGLGIILWLSFCATPQNLYFNQPFNFDRWVLFGLIIFSWFHPLFCTLFFSGLISFFHHLSFPLPDWEWMLADKHLPIQLYGLLTSSFLCRLILPIRARDVFVAFLACAGAIYFYGGITKILLGPTAYYWMFNNDISKLFVASYIVGFLGDWQEELILQAASILAVITIPLAIFTQFIELAGIALHSSARSAIIILSGLIGLHAGIVIFSGIFFWQYMACDLLLLWWIFLEPTAGDRTFNTTNRFLGPILVAMGMFYCSPIAFGWFDTGYVNYFRFEVETNKQRTVSLPSKIFAPYDMAFQQSRFFFLTENKYLVGTYGTAMNWQVNEFFNASSTNVDLDQYISKQGVKWSNAELKQKLLDFIEKYICHLSDGNRVNSLLMPIFVPYHFVTSDKLPNLIKMGEPLRINVYEVIQRYDGTSIEKISDRLIINHKVECEHRSAV